MRPLVSVLLLALSTTACSTLPWATRDVRGEVQALYNDVAAGIEARDVDRVTQYSLADARVEFADGTTLRAAQWKDSARAIWSNFKQVKASIVVADVQERDGGADVTYVETHDTLVLDPKTGLEHRVLYDGRWTAWLLQTAEGWRLSFSRELQRKITLDGKVVDETP